MKYWLPSYVPVKSNATVAALNARFAGYRQGMDKAFRAALMIGAKTKSNRYMLEQLLFKTDAKIVKDIIKHIRLLFKIMGRETGMEQHRIPARVVKAWFHGCVMLNGVEYVMEQGQWYERDWNEYKSDPEHDSAVIFYSQIAGTTGSISAITDSSGFSKLRQGTALLKQVDSIRKGSAGLLKKNRPLAVDSVNALNECLKAVSNINEQMHVKRHAILIKLVQEILDISRFVVLAGPLNVNDAEFYERWGYHKLVSLLQLVAMQHTSGPERVEIIEYDSRVLRPVYEKHKQSKPHTVVAAIIAQDIEAYANTRKTVNE